MNTYEIIKDLAKEKGISIRQLEINFGYSNGYIGSWKRQTPNSNELSRIADYFDVSVDYLLGRTEKKRYYDLTEKEKKDIAIQAERLLEGLDSDAETNYYGEPLDDEDKEKLYDAIQLALSLTKVKAKKKFTPKKYRQ
ncbi:helix-turn-helix domain-containing protein [Enterococcus hirae]|uniref:helix-turn-helix domain-containing protein n=1 Tax=Enterococcus hirae TaxID=1354 RepID=UPI000DE940D1|nr:helix-turn-helix transcriptional regulator [Enterococcus hirae]RBT59658.1 helix-turn-helix protein [Enterococcus hirae]